MTDKPKVDHAAAYANATRILTEQPVFRSPHMDNLARAYLERDAQIAKLRELADAVMKLDTYGYLSAQVALREYLETP
jgi:phosphosulfolactate phosphohydrolase-like enzyme